MILAPNPIIGSTSPPVAPPPAGGASCFSVGACQFSDASEMKVTKYNYASFSCVLKQDTEVVYFELAGYNNGVFARYEDPGDPTQWAEYRDGSWTWNIDGVGEVTGGGPLCPSPIGPSEVFANNCSGFLTRRFMGNPMGFYPILSGEIILNTCIPSIEV